MGTIPVYTMAVGVVTLLLSLTLCHSALAEYQPGTPGGAWSQEELLVVRAKLWELFFNPGWLQYQVYKFEDKYGLRKGQLKDLQHFTAKVLRLSFHDCIRYADGEGGCDGCLNWHGVGDRFPRTKGLKYKMLMDDLTETNNNGLEYAVAVLEELYADPNYPPNGPKLPESLKASGKSRADLWAYAAKVAVEYATEHNNYQCAEKPSTWVESGESMVKNMKDCVRDAGEEGCEVNFEREIQFQYGRSDCVSEYEGEWEQFKTDRPERHPNLEGNGDDTINFFNEEFGFSGRETVAIMGAHTLGEMNPAVSLLKYTWTTRAGNSFNNAYYNNFVKKNEWFIQSQDGDTCTRVGDAYGNLPDTKWVPTMNGFTKSGGPMHWIRMHYACQYCGEGATIGLGCCAGTPEGLTCRPDNATRNDVDDIKGCERYRFAFGKDEMMMNAEAGLYFKFDQENGIPKNCPGLEHFNMDNWIRPNGEVNKKDDIRRAYHMDCPLNDRRLPESDKPVSDIVQDYADDQVLWVSEFTAAFEKMTRNGYTDGELTDAPSSWENIQCKRARGVMTCQ